MDREYFDASGKLVHRASYGDKSSAPRGWRKRECISNDVQAVNTVKWLFQTFDKSDVSILSLLIDLNRRGVPSPAGKKWSGRTVLNLLTNRVYAGDAVLGKDRTGMFYQVGDDGEISKAGRRQATEGAIVVENAHPAIIERDLFNRVQTKLRERHKKQEKPRDGAYPLTGLLYCGHCGQRLAGRLRRYYTCNTRARGITRAEHDCCKSYSIRKDHIEPFLVKQLIDTVLSETNLEGLKAALRQRAKVPSTSAAKSDLKKLQGQLKKLEQQIETGTRNLLLADADAAPLAVKILQDWQKQRSALQSEIADATAETCDASQLVDQAFRQLGVIREWLATSKGAQLRAILRTFIDRITLYWEDLPTSGRGKTARVPRRQSRVLSRGVISFENIEGFDNSVVTPASLHAARIMLSQCDRLKRDRSSKEILNTLSLGIFRGKRVRKRSKAVSLAVAVRCPADSHFRS